MLLRISLSIMMCCGSVVASGCGGSGLSAPRTKMVRGTVFFKGMPAEGVRVVFHPQFDIGPVKFTPSGMTDRKGRFTLSTASPDDGAPVGEYAITFEKLVVVSDRKTGFVETETDAWKGKFGDPAASKHKVQIREDVDLEPFGIE